MTFWIRPFLSFAVFILIVGAVIAGPVIKSVQAKDMLAQMEVTISSELPINMELGCKSCAENEKVEHCSSLCTSATPAINENKSFELSKVSNEAPFIILTGMFEYTPGVEPTPPRT